MSQSPRKPQSKWGSPQEAPSGLPPNAEAAPDADVPPNAEAAPDAEVTGTMPGAVPGESASAADPPPPTSAPLAWPDPAQVAPVAVPPVAVPPVAAASAAVNPVLADDADSLTQDSAFDDKPASQLTLKDRLRRLSPVYVTLAVVSIGSVIFLALAVTSHTTPIAVLLSAGVVTFLAFGLDAAICSVASYGAGRREEAGRALLFALVGGVSAVICALSMAGTLIMILVLAG
jgi:hypothetical protein